MSKVKFLVRLKDVHDKTGLTPYAVAQKVNAAENTVRKYVESPVIVTDRMYGVIVDLCNFYGVDWRNPEIIGVTTE